MGISFKKLFKSRSSFLSISERPRNLICCIKNITSTKTYFWVFFTNPIKEPLGNGKLTSKGHLIFSININESR